MSKYYFEQNRAFRALDRLLMSEIKRNGCVEDYDFHILNLTNTFAVSETALRKRIELIAKVNCWTIENTMIISL